MIEKVILVDKNDNEIGTMEKQEAQERICVTLSIVSFVIHLLLIFLKYLEILNFS